MENIKNFVMDVNGEDSNIFATSYVSDPATGMGFLMFANEKEKKMQFAKMDNAEGGYQRMTAGVWMMPDTKYLRKDASGQYYTVQFTKETLKTGLLKYLKSDNANNVNVEHNGQMLQGFVAVEHWIITGKNTKSPVFGFSLADLGYNPDEIPVGTVMKTTFCADEKFWNEKVMTGEVTGYSIEGLFNLTEMEQQFKKQLKNQLFAALELPLIENATILIPKEKIGLKFKADAIYVSTYKNGKTEETLANGEYQIEEFGVVVKQGQMESFGKYTIERTCTEQTKMTEEYGDYIETIQETSTTTTKRTAEVVNKNDTAVDVPVEDGAENLVEGETNNMEMQNFNNQSNKNSKMEKNPETKTQDSAILAQLLEKFSAFEAKFAAQGKELDETKAKLEEKEAVIEKQVEKLQEQPLKKEEFKQVDNKGEGSYMRVGSKQVWVPAKK